MRGDIAAANIEKPEDQRHRGARVEHGVHPRQVRKAVAGGIHRPVNIDQPADEQARHDEQHERRARTERARVVRPRGAQEARVLVVPWGDDRDDGRACEVCPPVPQAKTN